MRIEDALFSMQDAAYRDFQRRLIPGVDPQAILGVRTPQLRALAKSLRGTPQAEAFLRDLPHALFEENQLHAFLIAQERDFGACLGLVHHFLPHVDNWATCDQLIPAALAGDLPRLLPEIRRWLADGHPYTVRFGLVCLLRWYLGDAFDASQLEMAAALRREEYYVNMAVAWYFAEALSRQYEAAYPFIENRRLPPWTHNRAIRKALESAKIPPERKARLRGLRV